MGQCNVLSVQRQYAASIIPHSMKSLPLIILLVVCTTSLCACLKPVHYGVNIEQETQNLNYGDIQITQSGPILEQWWEAYGDEELNQALHQTLNQNLTLKAAYFKILDAQLALEQTKSEYWPTASFSANAGMGGTIDGDENPWDPNYALGLHIGYEIDLWGRVRAQTHISQLDIEASRDAAQAASLSLAAQFVLAWFDVHYYRAQRKLNENLLKIAKDYLDLVDRSYRLGQASAVDVLEQNNQIRTLQLSAQKTELQEQLTLQKLQILGSNKVQLTIAPRDELPALIDVGSIVSPQALLDRRPDIRQALRQAQQADARIVIALANALPSLRLSAALNLRSTDITSLFSQLLWSLAANFVANLFDGLDTQRGIDRAKVSYLQQRLSYATTVINAVDEVQTALRQFEQSRIDWEQSLLTLKYNQELLELAKNAFLSGSVDYTRVLSALQSLIAASRSSLETHRLALQAQVSLFKAMGGTWMQDLSAKGESSARQALDTWPKEQNNTQTTTENDSEQ